MSIAERVSWALVALGLVGCAPESAEAEQHLGYEVIPGSFVPGKGPDGNSVFLDAPEGLILVDTGRHPAHRDKLLGYAKAKGKPLAAIINNHWHIDHTPGNAAIMAAYPDAAVPARQAIANDSAPSRHTVCRNETST